MENEPEIIETIEGLKNMRCLRPASEARIAAAEQALGVTFARDYREYVSWYGAICARGVELTGVTDSKRLNVADVTRQERELNPRLPRNMYVVENLGIDGILILQDSTGRIFSVASNQEPKFVAKSLSEYLRETDF